MLVQVPPREVVSDLNTGIVSPQLQFKPSATEMQFRAFATLWAIAALFHMAHSSVFDSQLNLALLTLAALYVLFRPVLGAFLLLIVLQVFDALFRMPYTTNHWLFTAFVNLSILQTFLFLVIRHKSFQMNGGDLFKSFSPVVRIEVIILYFFAVFHKLNSDFFSPETSCATALLKAQHFDAVVAVDERVFAVNAYFTLMVECLIPVLLCFRKTANVAVVLGLLFHCVLSYSSYNAFYDFSSMVFAVYFLFLHPDVSAALYEIPGRVRSFFRSFLVRYSTAKLAYAAAALLVALAVIYLLSKKIDTFQSVHLYFFWTLYSIAFAWIFIAGMTARKSVQLAPQPVFGVAHWSLVIVPLVVFMNGTSPYLGLKTENSYAMFSNLRTEGGKTNHLLVPAAVQIFDYQKEVVRIVSSTDPGLQKLAAADQAMVLFEFRNYVNERKPQRVEYLLNGEKRTFRAGENASAKALGKNPYMLAKLMKFRPFNPDSPQECAH